jgi:hypothetical protein
LPLDWGFPVASEAMARSPRYGDTVESSDAYPRLQQLIILVVRDDLRPAIHACFVFAAFKAFVALQPGPLD